MGLAFVLAATLPLVALAQQPERFDFNGIPLGITQAQFVERFPVKRVPEERRAASLLPLEGEGACHGTMDVTPATHAA